MTKNVQLVKSDIMVFKDDYKLLSGWIHDYYCDKDGSELIFDLDNNKFFECPLCHYKYNDIKKKRAWVLKYRYKIFDLLEKYAKQYLLENKKEYLVFIKDALEYYSLNYSNFKLHNKDGELLDNICNKGGKITSQGLNEAMIAIKIVNCLHNINSYIDEEIRHSVYEVLFIQIYQVLKSQINKVHNIACYEICAIAMMGIISNNKEMLEFAFDSPYSFYKQLDNVVTKDFLWFEGSLHYHFFVLKPILNLLLLAQTYSFEIPQRYYEIGKRMLTQGFKVSFNDCSLPSPNDGWPNRDLAFLVELYNWGNKLFDNEFLDITKSIIMKNNTFGTEHFKDTGFSILRNEYWNIFIKYKDNSFNHAHPDKLNIEIKNNNNFLTHDLATSGYGSDISKNYYKKSYSHNTVVVDGLDQNLECDTIIDYYSDSGIDIKIKNVYNNIDISRKIILLHNEIIDEVKVFGGNDKVVDYFFHCDANLISKLDFKSIESFKEYPYLKDIKEISFKSDFIILKWSLDNRVIVSKIDLKNKKLYIGSSPDNPDKKSRTTLLIRSDKNDDALFKISWFLKI